MRVVIDCNVLIAAAWKSGACRQVVQIAARDHEPCVTQAIVEEYRRVAAYPKFAHIREGLLALLTLLLEASVLVSASPATPRLPHRPDEAYLAAALGAGAPVLVTGNAKHFPARIYDSVRIVSPREFLDAVEA